MEVYVAENYPLLIDNNDIVEPQNGSDHRFRLKEKVEERNNKKQTFFLFQYIFSKISH